MAFNTFQSGQKLTAADLNNALDSIAGIQNPSNDYKWQQTSLGRMQTAWSTFLNTKNTNPQPLDVEVGIEQLSSAITVNGQACLGKRRVFMNLGNTIGKQSFGYYQVTSIKPLGGSNGYPFVAVLGAQYCYSDAPSGPKDNKIHWSLFADDGNDVEPSSDTPAEWSRVQKLYDDDVARNASPTNWWYTGVCLEHTRAQWLSIEGCIDIVGFPIYVPVKWNSTISSKDQHMWHMPILVVATSIDAPFVKIALQTSLGSSDSALARAIDTYILQRRSLQMRDDIVAVTSPDMEFTIAQYTYNNSTQNAFYKQLLNKVDVNYDFSAGHVHGMRTDINYDPGVVQYIDQTGAHKKAEIPHGLNDWLDVTDLNGDILDPGGDWEACLAMAYFYDTGEAILSCVSCDYSDVEMAGNEDPIAHVLSPIFSEFSNRNPDKRLIWVNRQGGRGMQYFDTCPNFSSQTPDSKLSALDPKLSSLQMHKETFTVGETSCTANVWSIYDFDDLDNHIPMPTDEEEVEKYDLICRYVEDDTAKVKYIELSSLSATSAVVSVDSEGSSGQKSIAWLSGNELELYKMEENGISVSTELKRVYDDDGGMNPPRLAGYAAVMPAESLSSQDVEFVIRKGGAGGEIDYAKVTLSAKLSAFAISGDADEVAWPASQHAHRSIEAKYNSATGNIYHQLYDFDLSGASTLSIQLSAGVVNPILPQNPNQDCTYDFVVRRYDTHNFEKEVDYLRTNIKMPAISGDSQISGTHDFSMVGTYTSDGAYQPALYNWHGGTSQHVHVKTDGDSYYWPQDQKTPSDNYYFLVKHRIGNDWILEYKQLIVDMPDIDNTIDNIEQNINEINSDVLVIQEDIDYLSGEIDAKLSADYWQSGDDENTCYGSGIGNSGKTKVIDLNSRQLVGNWQTTGNHKVNTLTIGNTTINEAQLQALLRLI